MSETQTGSSIAVRSSTDLDTLGELEEILLGNTEAPEVADDPEQISREILMDLLSAESDEELVQQNAQGWRELIGVPIEIHGFRWRPSEFDKDDKGKPQHRGVFFVVFGVRCDTGEHVTLTVGSRNVLAQMLNMARRGTLNGGIWAYTQASKKTAAGYLPSWLSVTPEVIEARQAREARQAAAANAASAETGATPTPKDEG